jgi:hypothetical protein
MLASALRLPLRTSGIASDRLKARPLYPNSAAVSSSLRALLERSMAGAVEVGHEDEVAKPTQGSCSASQMPA